MALLEGFNTYTVSCDSDVLCNTEDIENSSIKISTNTTSTFIRKYNNNYIVYNYNYTFYDIMENIMRKLLSDEGLNQSKIECFVAGMKILSAILKTDNSNVFINKDCMQLIHGIFNKYSMDLYYNLEVMKACFNMYVEMMTSCDDLIWNIFRLNSFLPLVAKDICNISYYFDNNFISHSLLLQMIDDDFKKPSYELLQLYLRFIKDAINVSIIMYFNLININLNYSLQFWIKLLRSLIIHKFLFDICIQKSF